MAQNPVVDRLERRALTGDFAMHGWRGLGLRIACVVTVLGVASSARGQGPVTMPPQSGIGISTDPIGPVPNHGVPGVFWSGFGYGGVGTRGPGYWVGLYQPNDNDGPSGAYSPIFNAEPAIPRVVRPAGTAAPRSFRDRLRSAWNRPSYRGQ
jgi:hypothetical protein